MIPLRLYLASFDIRDIRILSLFDKESSLPSISEKHLIVDETKRKREKPKPAADQN
jgi:hypothetical protein